MKRILLLSTFTISLNLLLILSSNTSTANVPNPNVKNTVLKYKETDIYFDHQAITRVATQYWSLSDKRAESIIQGSRMPDYYQKGLTNLFNQQWSHGLLLGKNRAWRWGDANEDFHDNLLGIKGNNNNNNEGDESDEGDEENNNVYAHEGWDGGSADQFYLQNNQQNGDWYIGYASHYIVDVTAPPHTTSPLPNRFDILYHHFDFELWVTNNLEKGHRLIDAAIEDNEYYTIVDPSLDLQNAAWKACYWSGDQGYGRALWDTYIKDGYPTDENSGSKELVEHAKKMIIEAARWSKGTIKWGLDQYNQWTDQY